MLAKDLEQATEMVFRLGIQEMSKKRCRFTEDSIESPDDRISCAPYLVYPDKFNPGKFLVKIKWEFDRLDPSDFDPQHRFSFQKVTKREF